MRIFTVFLVCAVLVAQTTKKAPEKPERSPRLVFARVQRKVSWEKFVSDAYWNVELKE